MIDKYRNEIMILFALVLLVSAVIYRNTSKNSLDKSLEENQIASRQITELKTFQKVWSSKGIKNKISKLRTILPSNKVKKFNEKKNKLELEFVDMSSKELNNIVTTIASLPLHINKIDLNRSGDKYNIGCSCSW